MARAQSTTDHNVIRSWIETRKGHPSVVVRATEGRKRGSAGLLRVDFNEPEDALEEISWDDFFDTFDSNELAFLYQDETAAGRKSRFHKFVSRDSVDESSEAAEASDDSSRSTSRKSASAGNGGGTRQATPEEEEDAEEADEDDADEDEDLEEDDLDDDDDDDIDDEDLDEEEDEKPSRKGR